MDRRFLGVGGRRSVNSATRSDDDSDNDDSNLHHDSVRAFGRDVRLEMRIWMSLVSSARSMENFLGGKLRQEFGTSLSRFDVLVLLDEAPNGLRMSDLSKLLMVSNGTSTGVVAGLVNDGLVERVSDEEDRRTITIRITNAGRAIAQKMAKRHEEWVISILGELSRAAKRDLLDSLVILNRHILQD